MHIDQELTVRAEKVAHGGFVIARCDGKVLFVRKALPGELIKVRVTRKVPGGRAWIAEAIDVLEANPNRVTPPCEYFEKLDCGGCDFQHAAIDYQLELKLSVLVEQMQRLANLSVTNLVKTHQLEPKDFYWRTKLRLAPTDKGELGYRRFRSHQIIPIHKCLIAVNEINELLKNNLGKTFANEQLLIAEHGQAEFISINSTAKTTTNILGHDFVHARAGFWQSHLQAAEKLSSLLLTKVKSQNNTLDLYAGVGIFGRLLLENKKTQNLTSVELDGQASACAKENLTKFPQAQILTQRAEEFLSRTNDDFDLVVLDPPRKGLGIEASRHLAKVAKQQIIYLACDPASLARDTKILTENGWVLSQLDLIDAFPQTHHLETMAVFSRVN